MDNERKCREIAIPESRSCEELLYHEPIEPPLRQIETAANDAGIPYYAIAGTSNTSFRCGNR
jgi:hypothetical protein